MKRTKFYLWVPEDFPDWLRQRVKEQHGTTYGYLSDTVVKACENWFNDIQKDSSSSSTKSPNAPRVWMGDVLKGYDARVRHTLDLIVSQLRLEYEEVTEPILDNLIDRLGSRNHSIAAKRTKTRYKDLMLTDRFVIPDRVSPSGVQIFKVNHEEIKDFQSQLRRYA